MNNNIIFSHATALSFHDLSLREPLRYDITVMQGYNAKHIIKKHGNVDVHYVKKEIFELGMSTKKTIFGDAVPCYDVERTICDVIKWQKNIDPEIFARAISKYFQNKNKNLTKLLTYAEKMNILNKVKRVLTFLNV
ncbi:type IV toxin-antitoxin system AbiEi family antitoxin domain-containing protein [Mycoplasma sp. 3341]|uniref:type IV toxin-antitoxin system AbiEi family antitoxin domain-containing protein n=1 Tax=Mycoplasma sp. 3341 TaxID=3447506 RepID=UPI003F65703A